MNTQLVNIKDQRQVGIFERTCFHLCSPLIATEPPCPHISNGSSNYSSSNSNNNKLSSQHGCAEVDQSPCLRNGTTCSRMIRKWSIIMIDIQRLAGIGSCQWHSPTDLSILITKWWSDSVSGMVMYHDDDKMIDTLITERDQESYWDFLMICFFNPIRKRIIMNVSLGSFQRQVNAARVHYLTIRE